MCYQLISSGTPAISLDMRSPLFFTMCSYALWDCQTLFRNWVIVKVVFECMTKHGMECNLPLIDNMRDISGALELVKFECAWPCQHD
jgi:hypothetical protein